MEIRQLRYFVTVAEEGGFARAAERLSIVQPAVSQQIARLERELGLRLFDRSLRRIRLTRAGERLLPEARALLAGAERIRRTAYDIASGTEGILCLGTSQGLGDRLERVLRKLSPPLTIRLDSMPVTARLAAVRSGRLDAAFVRALDTAPGLELIPMWTDPLVVALPAAHPLTARPVIALEDLAGMSLRLVPRADNPPLHDLLMTACRDAGFEPVLGVPFTNMQDTLAEIGTGVTSWTVLYQTAARLNPSKRVAFRPLVRPSVVTSLAVLPDPPGPSLRLLLETVHENFGPQDGGGRTGADGAPDDSSPFATK